MPSDVPAIYVELLRMAESERDLITAGRWDELVRHGEERAALTASLPTRPPLAARDVIDQVRRQLALNAAALDRVRTRRVVESMPRVAADRIALRFRCRTVPANGLPKARPRHTEPSATSRSWAIWGRPDTASLERRDYPFSRGSREGGYCDVRKVDARHPLWERSSSAIDRSIADMRWSH